MALSAETANRRALHDWLARFHVIIGALMLLGLVMIYSATSVSRFTDKGEYHFVMHQSLWLLVGLAGWAVASAVPFSFYRRIAIPLAAGCFVLLALVPFFGKKVGGATRWFHVAGHNVQPSELAKCGIILFMALILSRSGGEGAAHSRKSVVGYWGIIFLTMGLLFLEPDLGTAALFGVVLYLMLMAGGVPVLATTLVSAVLAAAAAGIGLTLFEYPKRRLMEWLAGEGSHTNLSLTVIGSGGASGFGLGEGPAKLTSLPESHTDFIFAITGQELGLAGTWLLLALFAGLAAAGLSMAWHARDPFARLAIFGFTALFGLQAAFNMGVVSGLLPPKGIQLPFVSYGGSGLCVNMAMAGIIGSAARAKAPDAERTAGTAAPPWAGWRGGEGDPKRISNRRNSHTAPAMAFPPNIG